MLRCVEGIRMYAAEHEGELPKSLDDITRVPIPVNPFTGEDFIYKVEQNKAILAWASDFEYPFDKLQYEITIRK